MTVGMHTLVCYMKLPVSIVLERQSWFVLRQHKDSFLTSGNKSETKPKH